MKRHRQPVPHAAFVLLDVGPFIAGPFPDEAAAIHWIAETLERLDPDGWREALDEYGNNADALEAYQETLSTLSFAHAYPFYSPAEAIMRDRAANLVAAKNERTAGD